MAWPVVARAWTVEGLNPSEKLVLLRLADAARENDGTKSFESQTTIAAVCGLGVRQVRRILETLSERQLIIIHPRQGPRPARYHVLPDRTSASALDRTSASALAQSRPDTRPDISSTLDRTSETPRPDISSSAYKERTCYEPLRTFNHTGADAPAVSSEGKEHKSQEELKHYIALAQQAIEQTLKVEGKEDVAAICDTFRAECDRTGRPYTAEIVTKAVQTAWANRRLRIGA